MPGIILGLRQVAAFTTHNKVVATYRNSVTRPPVALAKVHQ